MPSSDREPAFEWDPALRMATDRRRSGARAADVITLIGGLLVGLAALLPWMSVIDHYGRHYQFSAFGHIGDDGIGALALAAVAVCLGAAGMAGARSVLMALGTIAVGGLAIWMACVDIWAVKVRAVRADVLYAGADMDPGAGLYLLFIAGSVLCPAGLLALIRR